MTPRGLRNHLDALEAAHIIERGHGKVLRVLPKSCWTLDQVATEAGTAGAAVAHRARIARDRKRAAKAREKILADRARLAEMQAYSATAMAEHLRLVD